MIKRLILVAICIVALAGFFLPAVNLQLSFLGMGRSTGFSLRTPFERSDTAGLGGAGGFGASDLTNMVNIDMRSMSDSVGRRIIIGVISYMAAFFVLAAVFVLTALGKLRKATAVLHLMSIGLLAIFGWVMISIPNEIAARIRDSLGIMAVLINAHNLVSMSLGTGYWVTMFSLVILLLVKIGFAAAEFQVPESARSSG